MSNNLADRRTRDYMRIPKGMASAVAKHNALIKPLAVYFELKSLFYSAVIVSPAGKKTALYKRLSEFLGASQSATRYKLTALIKMGLAWYDDGNNLCLASRQKMCRIIEDQLKEKDIEVRFRHRHFHEIKNRQKTEYLLRALAIKENKERQQAVIDNKIFAYEKLQDASYRKLQKGDVSPPQAWDRYYAELLKYLPINKTLQKQKSLILGPINRAKMMVKFRKLHDQKIGQMEQPEVNPTTTLSCYGTARMFGANSASAGHYWQQRLQELGLLNIENRSIKIDRTRLLAEFKVANARGLREAPILFNGIHIRDLNGKAHFFKTLSNILTPIGV